MNSRERVLATLEHRQPDRLPFDLGSTQVSGIHVRSYRNLRASLELPTVEPCFSDVIQQLAHQDEDAILTLVKPLREV